MNTILKQLSNKALAQQLNKNLNYSNYRICDLIIKELQERNIKGNKNEK